MAERLAVGPREPTDPAAEHLLAVDQQPNNPDNGRLRNAAVSIPWLTVLGFAFLTFNSAMALYRSQGDKMAILFVGFSYGDLVLLFGCLRMYERAAPGSVARDRLKIAVWILTTLLTFAFSYKVAAIMPPAVAMLVWLMAFATVAGGFFAFFIYEEKN